MIQELANTPFTTILDICFWWGLGIVCTRWFFKETYNVCIKPLTDGTPLWNKRKEDQ